MAKPKEKKSLKPKKQPAKKRVRGKAKEAKVEEQLVQKPETSIVRIVGTKNLKAGEPYYIIRDRYFPDFTVMYSANGWWLDGTKVSNLIAAFKIDCTIEEACIYAGISVKQYKYFVAMHQEFSTVKEACRNLPVLRARMTVTTSLTDPDMAMRYLERKRKNEFSTKSEVDFRDRTPQELSPEKQKQINEALVRGMSEKPKLNVKHLGAEVMPGGEQQQ